MIWDVLPFIALITVEGNEQRVAEFFQDAARVGLTPNLVRVYQFRKNNFGTDNVDHEITLSHQTVMWDALKMDAPCALIFEDDSRFYPNITNLADSVEWLTAHRKAWDLFFLGAFHTAPSVPIGSGVAWTMMPILSHAYVISAPMMRRCVRELAVGKFTPVTDHIDMWFARTGLRKYAAFPQLCYQCETPRAFPAPDIVPFKHVQQGSDYVWLAWVVGLIVICIVLQRVVVFF